MRKMKPKGKRGMVAVKRLGRNYKTGTFEQIEAKAAEKYGSKETGSRVAGSIYWRKVRQRHKKGK